MYRCEATSVEGFVQQVAVSYLRNGYWFYVAGRVPEHKDPADVDRKLIEKYSINRTKWQRARRKRSGLANMQYIRHGRFFLLLATSGKHHFFAEEAKRIRDARRAPIRFAGYSLSHRGGHPHVRIDRESYSSLKAYLLEQAVKHSAETLQNALRKTRFAPFAPVRRQILNIRRAVNRVRTKAGLGEVPITAVRMRRMVMGVFDGESVFD